MIIVKCDRCGKEQQFSTFAQQGFVDVCHPVSPGNSKDNDRVLCINCYREYGEILKPLEMGVVERLLQWIDHKE